MKFIETGNPDILKTRRGGGMAMVFGITFLLTGILVVSLSFRVSGDTPWYVPAIFGTVFLALGIAMTFGRNGIVVDRRKGTMIHWFGLMVPMRKTFYRLHVYDHISIRKDIHHDDKSSYYVYPVAIRSKLDRVTGLIFHEPADYIQARKEAKKISAFLGLPIIDVSSGEEVVREPKRLNETLRNKVKRTGKRMRTLSPPPSMASSFIEDGERLVINIPPRRITTIEIKRMAFLVIMGIVSLFVVTGLEHLKDIEINQFIAYVPIGIVIVLFAVRPILYQAKKSWRITVSGESLTVENLGSGRKSTIEIALNELEELVMGDPVPVGGEAGKMSAGRKFLVQLIQGPGKQAIKAISDKATVTFGHGVEERELDFLYKLIKKRITS